MLSIYAYYVTQTQMCTAGHPEAIWGKFGTNDMLKSNLGLNYEYVM